MQIPKGLTIQIILLMNKLRLVLILYDWNKVPNLYKEEYSIDSMEVLQKKRGKAIEPLPNSLKPPRTWNYSNSTPLILLLTL